MGLDKSDRLVTRVGRDEQQIRFPDRANSPAYCSNLVRITQLRRKFRNYFGICFNHGSDSAFTSPVCLSSHHSLVNRLPCRM
jgi:hypothetical protein